MCWFLFLAIWTFRFLLLSISGQGVSLCCLFISFSPTISSCPSSCPFLAQHLTPVIPVIGGVLFMFVLGTLLRTSFSDPGVLPRATADEAADLERQIGKTLIKLFEIWTKWSWKPIAEFLCICLSCFSFLCFSGCTLWPFIPLPAIFTYCILYLQALAHCLSLLLPLS